MPSFMVAFGRTKSPLALPPLLRVGAVPLSIARLTGVAKYIERAARGLLTARAGEKNVSGGLKP